MRWTDSDRVLPEVIIYPTTDGLTSGVHHQKGARRPSFGDGLHPEPSSCSWWQPFLLRAAYQLDLYYLDLPLVDRTT